MPNLISLNLSVFNCKIEHDSRYIADAVINPSLKQCLVYSSCLIGIRRMERQVRAGRGLRNHTQKAVLHTLHTRSVTVK